MAFLSFIVVFGIVSIVHELGHFLTGKAFGFRILEFAIGFGPAIFRRKKGETEYAVRILPLGGLNRFDDGEDGRGADARSFANKPYYQRFLVILAGSAMNILLAILLVSILFTFTGTPVISIADTVPGSPAEASGIIKDDIILEIEGQAMLTSESIVSILSASEGQLVDITIDRAGERLTIGVTPEKDPEDGRAKIGIYMQQVLKRKGAAASFSDGVRFLYEIIKLTVRALGEVVTGRGLDQISGPVGIAVASAEAARNGIASFVLLIALISVSLGVFNLIPLPILDGGWLVFMTIERITGKKIPDKLMYSLKIAGIALFIALAVYATYSDVLRIFLGR